MAFRKQMALMLALLVMVVCFGCADDVNAPNTEDTQPVLPPTNVVASALADGGVQVTWDPSSQPDISGYNLYRREVANGNPNRLNSARIVSTRYVDRTTQGYKEYEYRVMSVNSKGKESRPVVVVIETRGTRDGDGGDIPVPGED